MKKRRLREISILVLCFAVMISSLSCSLVANRNFSVVRWRGASQDERRQMAEDFLKKHDTRGMTVDELKVLLGDPDYETDFWNYHLSVKNARPSGPKKMHDFLQHPELSLHFKEGRVDNSTIINGLEPKDELPFDPKLWREGKPPDRFRMTARLVAEERLKGLSKEEVRQLLGESDGKSEQVEIQYHLGYRMIDLVTLTFTLDSAGRVAEAKVIEH